MTSAMVIALAVVVLFVVLATVVALLLVPWRQRAARRDAHRYACEFNAGQERRAALRRR